MQSSGSDGPLASSIVTATASSIPTGPVRSPSIIAVEPAPSATTVTIQLGPATELPALGRATRSVNVSGPDTYWITDDRTPPERSLIVGSEPPRQPRALFAPTRTGAHFQALKVAPRWMVWLEHVETQTWHDAQIYAAVRGGTPILIDDMARYGDLVTFPELALDGADLYWTVPEVKDGAWSGRLLHRNLDTATTESIEVGVDTVFSAPAAAHGAVAYEVATRMANAPMSVRVRSLGQVVDVAGPASEPALGADYVLFKRGNRFDPGTIESVLLSLPKRFNLGHGEQPLTDGALAVWFDSSVNEAIVARPADGCIATTTANHGRTDGTALVTTALGGSRLAWSGLKNVNGVVTEFVRTATLERMSC